MNYFTEQKLLLQNEKKIDQEQFDVVSKNYTIYDRRNIGQVWYPISIKSIETTKGDYLNICIERNTFLDIQAQFKFGSPVSLFSNFDPEKFNLKGIVTHFYQNTLHVQLRIDELPDWMSEGKIGVVMEFDDYNYKILENHLDIAEKILTEDDSKNPKLKLINKILGKEPFIFNNEITFKTFDYLNESQQKAVNKMLQAEDVCVVHGPPGTGKTTTVCAGIKALWEQEQKTILALAPSNIAVDVLTEKLNQLGMNVTRIGNPSKISESLMQLSLDQKMIAHPETKNLKKIKKQAQELRSMAYKYKRSFGKSEREQRNALFAEVKNLGKDIEKTEKYIREKILKDTEVITATLVGSQWHMLRSFDFHTIVIDEAAQAMECATWVPVCNGSKIIFAGDPFQLPPVIKSTDESKKKLETTLMEKIIQNQPESVVLLNQQYRMHDYIMQYSSSTFYNSELKSDASVASQKIFSEDTSIEFIDTAGCGFEELKEINAISNPEEMILLFKHLQAYIESLNFQHISIPNIGILSPYKSQIQNIQKEILQHPFLNSYLKNIQINTIDGFQGQEKDVIYISLCRSNSDERIGFLEELRRMNVAMTRAKMKLVIIGDSATIGSFDFYNGLITYIQSIDGYKSAWEYMDY